MSNPASSHRRLGGLTALLTLLALIGMLVLAHFRGSWSVVAGDESTFVSMAESLAFDGDLVFDELDRARFEAASEPGRKSVILQRVGERVGYSKPVLYPLLAAPAYRLLGGAGMVLTNCVALLVALLLFWRSLPPDDDRGRWSLTLASFAASAALLAQVGWATADSLQVALALAGAVLALAARNQEGGARASAVVGGLLLGLLVAMRLPNGLLAAAVIGALASEARGRRALQASAGVIVGIGLALALNTALIGSANPYRAERATFNEVTGYPAGAGAEEAARQFETGRATQRLAAVPNFRPGISAYASLYLFLGRHTGLLWYFPLAVVLSACVLRTGGRRGWALLAGFVALAGFYLVWMPENYFGGAAFVGNRYLLPAYALLLPALSRPPSVRWQVAVWLLSAVLFGSALASVMQERGRPFSSQSHAFAGVFRWLPYESTALAIENREDRYYSDEFLRFVDRNAQPREHGFHLTAGAPESEVLLAMPRPSGIMRFLVRADRPEATLVYRDWRGERRYELESDPEGAVGWIELVATPAWRRHGFWWSSETWHAHSIRFSLDADEGARADVRYVGPYRLAEKFFAYEVGSVELPRHAEPGSSVAVTVGLVNRGLRPWATEADLPILLRHRVERDDGTLAMPSGYTTIEGPVERGESIALEFEIEWPLETGSYRLALDLVAGGVRPFEEWVGRPVATAPVAVSRGPE